MFISKRCLSCFVLLELCVCVFFFVTTTFHVENGIPQKMYRYKTDAESHENSSLSEREHSKSDTFNFSFSEQIDLVVTWVNGSDPSLIKELKRFNITSNSDDSSSPNKYRDWGTLRYCLRSVEKNANWIRHIYIVTNGQVPRWLNIQNPRVSIVKHSVRKQAEYCYYITCLKTGNNVEFFTLREGTNSNIYNEIFTNKSHLPTFNSMAIESHIHRISGLSQQFVYINDDIFFAGTVVPEDFYSKETGFKIRVEKSQVPDCSKTCKLSDINNGICDTECNTSRCDWDGDDCQRYHTSNQPLTGLRRFRSFFGSILYTVFVYNKAFGYVYRRMQVHTPHLIDVSLMYELQNRFPEGWQKTSASRFRDSYNFQYAFAYYHYLMNPQRCIQKKEGIKPIATTMRDPNEYSYFTTGNYARLQKSLQRYLKNKYKKFACINDKMHYWNATEESRCQIVIDRFLKQLFPETSSFELEDEY